MSIDIGTESAIRIPGTRTRFLEPAGPGTDGTGRLRYLAGGTGPPLVLLHTVRTQAEHFRHVIPLVQERCTVYADVTEAATALHDASDLAVAGTATVSLLLHAFRARAGSRSAE